MSLHLRIEGTRTFCGNPGFIGLTMRWITRHQKLAARLVVLFGCRKCVEEWDEAFHRALNRSGNQSS